MRYGCSGLAVLAAAAFMSAVSPALAARATCIARDSAGRRYVQRTSGLVQAREIARGLVRADCRDHSKHPHSCRIIFCRVTGR